MSGAESGGMVTAFGIGAQKALGEAAQGLGMELAATYAATRDGFAALRERLASSDPAPESITVLVAAAPSAMVATERLLAEFLRLEAAGARLIDAEGKDELATVLSAAQGGDPPVSDRARKIRETMSRKAMRGLVLGRIPYGYRAAADGALQEAPDEAVVVRDIFRLATEERGIRAIVKDLNARDLRTRRGGAWSMITIRDMLRNRVYTGTYDRFGARVTGNHPALVSSDDFKTIQERLDSMAQRSGYGPGTPYLLSGTALCGACGSRMIGVTRRQTWRRADGTRASNVYRYYQCEAATNQSRCSYHTRRASDLDAEVLASLQQAGIASAATAALDARVAVLTKEAAAGRVTATALRREVLPLLRAAEALEKVIQDEADASENAPFAALLTAATEDPALRSLLREALQHRIERVVVGKETAQVVMRS